MKALALALVFAVFDGQQALLQTVDQQALAFGCEDLVVIGRVKNGDWHHVDDPDDILGHGWVDARLSVRRIVKGNGIDRTVPVHYFAHTFMRDDRDFMFVLSRHPDGSLVISTGQLMSAHPKLAGQCS